MQTSISVQLDRSVSPEGPTVSELVVRIRKLGPIGTGEHTQHLEIHPCRLDVAEVWLARHTRLHSLLDDNPCSG
jgi:hypothetical protein